jgi:hypothetical protein
MRECGNREPSRRGSEAQDSVIRRTMSAHSASDGAVRFGHRGAADREVQLKSRIDRFALEREHPEDALVHAPKRLVAHEALEPFDAERKLAQRERTFCG